MDAVELF